MINKLRTMISKWVLEDKLNDQANWKSKIRNTTGEKSTHTNTG